jgi:hypothetical protein
MRGPDAVVKELLVENQGLLVIGAGLWVAVCRSAGGGVGGGEVVQRGQAPWVVIPELLPQLSEFVTEELKCLVLPPCVEQGLGGCNYQYPRRCLPGGQPVRDSR